MLHMKPIRGLENVEQGIIEFENTLIEYAQAGGTAMNDDEMKSDLLAIPPSSSARPSCGRPRKTAPSRSSGTTSSSRPPKSS